MHDRHTQARCKREGRNAYQRLGANSFSLCPYPDDDIRAEWFADGMREAHEEHNK